MKLVKFIFLIFIIVASVFTTHGNEETGTIYSLENLLDETETRVHPLHEDLGDSFAFIKNSRRGNSSTNQETLQNEPFYFLFSGVTCKQKIKKYSIFNPCIDVCQSGEISFLHRFQLY
ncbi:hypothetical protein H9Y05_14640 [Crocinitomicaceae bacterium CZZ-1]|uniref:Uncharacterized protein n=1 Tax=Taishania pollutisoli TaxID=2766479 RepID=A0A8J6PAZ6_9FLAO|nr:hypothetical protein [Taishania pollutisoli]MBC9813711.1 hypothetical protein [Taishania pollutisoli]MBX2950778.1 hypothetical protein [Crocinitomicaceae bacterium]NGF77224.1 hypothetical protein [Fluviicola sp. SGL-29]